MAEKPSEAQVFPTGRPGPCSPRHGPPSSCCRQCTAPSCLSTPAGKTASETACISRVRLSPSLSEIATEEAGICNGSFFMASGTSMRVEGFTTWLHTMSWPTCVYWLWTVDAWRTGRASRKGGNWWMPPRISPQPPSSSIEIGTPQSALTTHATALILSFRLVDLTIWLGETSCEQRSEDCRQRLQA